MHESGLLLAPLGATLRIADGVAALLLLLFVLWGARRGGLRQAFSFALLVGALMAARFLAPHVVETVDKVTNLEGGAQEAAAWGGVLFGALVLGGVLAAFLGSRLPDRAASPAGRFFGGLLGACVGGLVLVAVGYVLPAFGGPGDTPALSRTEGAEAPVEPDAESPWTARLHDSVSAHVMAAGAEALGPWLDLPPWLEARRLEIDQALGTVPPAETRPSGR